MRKGAFSAPFFVGRCFAESRRPAGREKAEIDARRGGEYGKMGTAIRIQGNIQGTPLRGGVKGEKR